MDKKNSLDKKNSVIQLDKKLIIHETIKTKLNSAGGSSTKFSKAIKNEDIFNFLKNNMKQPKKA